jgi:ParB family chromosome partitioning protein
LDDEDRAETGKPLSDVLIRDLTAHRTLALRLVLGEQPDVALIATVHAMVAQTFYHQDTSAPTVPRSRLMPRASRIL